MENIQTLYHNHRKHILAILKQFTMYNKMYRQVLPVNAEQGYFK